MNRRKRLDARQLAREKILFRYSSALDRGDFDVIAAIMREAENDPILAQLLWEMNQVYQTEVPGLPAPALPSLHLSNNHNHRTMREDRTMTTYTVTLRRMPRTTYSRWMPITLAAAVIALALFGAVLFSLRGRDPQGDNMAALQPGSSTATPGPSTTPTPGPSATFTPFPSTMLAPHPTTVPVEYVVQAGDTMASILTRFNITIAQFASVNPELTFSGCDMDTAGGGTGCLVTLFAGQTVRLPFSDGDNSDMLMPTYETGISGAACQGIITGSPHAEVFSVPSFDASQFIILGRIPAGAVVSVLQFQPPNDPSFPTTAWYFISWQVNGASLMGWIDAMLVQLSGDCTSIFPQADPCQLPVTPAVGATATFTPTPAQQVGGTGADQTQGTSLPPTIVPPAPRCTHTPTPTPFDFVPSVPGATPTAGFDSVLRFGGYHLVTTEQIGAIPAGTRVLVAGAHYDGTEWIYEIVANDGRTTAQARESQLAYAPGATPGSLPPTRAFEAVIGTGSYSLMTTEAIGSIPAETYVRVWGAWWNGETWIYEISDERGQTEEAREDQLIPAPGVTPGAPTPAGSLFGVRGYNLVTLVDVGGIPAGTPVMISSGYYNGREWVYSVTTEDGRFADALESQLTIVPGQPTPSSTPFSPSDADHTSTPTAVPT